LIYAIIAQRNEGYLMKKILTLSAASLLLTAQLTADVTAYIGLGVNGGTGLQTGTYADATEFETEYTAGAGTFKLGTIDKSNNRFEVVFTSVVGEAATGTFAQNTSGDTINSSYTGIDLNSIWTLGENKHFAPFFGFGVGLYSNNSIEGNNTSTGELESVTGFSANLSLGVLFSVIDLLEFEVALNSKAMAWNLEDPSILDALSTAYVGVNFRF
jgi:hypothetical protein